MARRRESMRRREPPLPALTQQISFRPQRRTGHEQHVVTVIPYQVLATQERILLCASHNHPRNDMGYPHRTRTSRTLPVKRLEKDAAFIRTKSRFTIRGKNLDECESP